jgi:pyruvate/2-oxoglutarate dehydrogenase complex dihydrolipoamide acyltransferase (E2) component
MQLTDEQKQKVAAWLADGLKISDIQTRLETECGLRVTYMDVRFLVDDLKLVPKDPPAPPAPAPEPVAAAPAAPAAAEPAPLFADPAAGPASKITLSVDQIAKPGTMVSGSVTFSDGKPAAWYLDQGGRLGVVPPEQGYRPPAGDVEEFQVLLDRELQKLGY